jgi:multidrug resistance efflux pump
MTAAAAGTTAAATLDATPLRAKRKKTPLLLASLAIVAVSVTGAWRVTHAGRESTDDVQVEGHVMTVSPRVSGQVLHVHVRNTKRWTTAIDQRKSRRRQTATNEFRQAS